MAAQPRPIRFSVRKPVAEIPANAVARAQYDRIFKAVTTAPANQPYVPIVCINEDEAEKLRNRLYQATRGAVKTMRPKGSRTIYAYAAKPRVSTNGHKKTRGKK